MKTCERALGFIAYTKTETFNMLVGSFFYPFLSRLLHSKTWRTDVRIAQMKNKPKYQEKKKALLCDFYEVAMLCIRYII